MGKYCHLGCENPGKPLYQFPCMEKDAERRRYWLEFFGLEEPNKKFIYACPRHFSSKQEEFGKKNRLRVPDIPLNSLEKSLDTTNTNSFDSVQIAETLDKHHSNIKPIINTMACSTSAQTNTRLCGSVEISETLNEYQLNCFYCSDMFSLEKWSEFVDHLKEIHFEREEAFKIDNYVDNNHDYKILNLKSPLTENIEMNSVKVEVIESRKTFESIENPLDIELAETVIKVLDETLFNANFKPTEDNNIKPSISKNFMENKSTVKPTAETNLRQKKSIAYKLKSNIARFKRTLKKSNNIKAPSKPRPQRVMSSGIFYIKDIGSNKEVEKQTSEQTVQNTCINNAFTGKSKVKPTELVFEFTPRGIILDLLENMKHYNILWKFHKESNNEDYSKTIDELCSKINNKWSFNISPLQMRRSINRILAYYCSMIHCEKVEIFQEYFVILSEFLPSSKDGIPQKRCEYCDICYRKDSELKKHLVEKHVYMKWPYECDYCLERFMENDEYELHKNLPHLKEIFKCQHCKRTFKRLDVLNKHLNEHQLTPKLRKCNLCGKEFKTSSELSCHKKYHGEKRFKCHLCEKAFYRQFCLKDHLKRHRNELDFICEICGKAFLTQKCLRNHKFKHTGEKITCNICNTKLSKTSLGRHLRLVHVAYEGTIESTFRSKAYNYKRYIENQPRNARGADKARRKYICKNCNIQFDRLKLLKDHNKEFHSNIQMVSCKICDSKLTLKSNIRRHYKEKHKLHMFQICKLLNGNEDVNAVLNMKPEDFSQFGEVDRYTNSTVKDRADDKLNKDVTNHNDRIEENELIHAVENIEKQDIKVNYYAMNEYFEDLL